MRSSGSTSSRSRSAPAPFPLFILRAGDDHGRACTGLKLLARGLAQPTGQRPRPGGGYSILLDPRAPTPLSAADRPRAEASGLLVVDCSWNQLDRRGGFPPGLPGLHHQPHRRRLPFLRAANPQHYGRLAELNTAEALGASLYLLGERARASTILDGFAGGASFLELNREALDDYGACATPEQVHARERRALGAIA